MQTGRRKITFDGYDLYSGETKYLTIISARAKRIVRASIARRAAPFSTNSIGGYIMRLMGFRFSYKSQPPG